MGDHHEQRNVEAVEGYFDSINHGQEVISARKGADWAEARQNVVSDLLHENFEMHFRSADGTPEAYVGAGSFVDAGTAWLAPWRAYETQLEEAIPIGRHVVVVSRARAVPTDGGEPVEQLVTFVWTFAGGRVTRMEHFRTKDAAIAAARADR
jgi:ketosteroid isomerase-like protein